MSRIIDFYLKKGTDSEGRTLEEEVHKWSDEAIEFSHDSIQWLFPLKELSNFNPDAPLLTDDDIAKWKVDEVLRNNLRISFERFVKFLGLQWEGVEVKLAENFDKRIPTVWLRFNHNWLRITRCLSSLRMLVYRQKQRLFM